MLNGILVPVCVSVGDRVEFPSWADTTIVDETGRELLLINDQDLLAVQEPSHETPPT